MTELHDAFAEAADDHLEACERLGRVLQKSTPENLEIIFDDRFPDLNGEDVLACVAYANQVIRQADIDNGVEQLRFDFF